MTRKVHWLLKIPPPQTRRYTTLRNINLRKLASPVRCESLDVGTVSCTNLLYQFVLLFN